MGGTPTNTRRREEGRGKDKGGGGRRVITSPRITPSAGKPTGHQGDAQVLPQSKPARESTRRGVETTHVQEEEEDGFPQVGEVME